MSEFGNKLKQYRNDLGMNQTDFANEIGMSKAFYNRIEMGLAKCPISKIDNIVSLLNRHGIDTSHWDEWKLELAQERISLSEIHFNQQLLLLKLSNITLSDNQIEDILNLI